LPDRRAAPEMDASDSRSCKTGASIRIRFPIVIRTSSASLARIYQPSRVADASFCAGGLVDCAAALSTPGAADCEVGPGSRCGQFGRVVRCLAVPDNGSGFRARASQLATPQPEGTSSKSVGDWVRISLLSVGNSAGCGICGKASRQKDFAAGSAWRKVGGELRRWSGRCSVRKP